MGTEPGETSLRYSAFISYSHADTAFARRLHRRLEAYRLPRRLVHAGAAASEAPRRLKPVFRDRDELAASSDLTASVRTAIAESGCLIVVCSQAGASSEWVGREVALFRTLHGDAGILAALVDGANGAVFPPALLAGEAGAPGRQPLAADFGRRGDGDRLALLKLVAVLASVRLDALVQRDAQRRLRLFAFAGAAAFAGMAVLAVLTVAAVNARLAAEREQARGQKLIEYQLTDLRSRLKGVGRLDLLDAVNQGANAYYAGQDLSRLSEAALEQRAKLLQAQGEDDEKRGKLAEARAGFEEARRSTAALLAEHPDDETRIFAQSQSEYWVASIDWGSDDLARAEAGFETYAALVRRLVRMSPQNPKWLLEMAAANMNLGTCILRRRALPAQAEPYFISALQDRLKVVQTRPNDRDLQENIADTYAWLGDTARVAGRYDAALEWRARERTILDVLLAPDPRDAEIRSDLVSNALAVARIEAEQGKLSDASALLEKARRDAEVLMHEDMQNVGNYRQTRILELFQARTWMMMPLTQQSAVSDLPARLGACDHNATRPDSEELLSFCTILQARLLNLQGNREAAAHLLTQAYSRRAGRDEKLSARWGLNLSDEARLAEAATPRSSMQ